MLKGLPVVSLPTSSSIQASLEDIHRALSVEAISRPGKIPTQGASFCAPHESLEQVSDGEIYIARKGRRAGPYSIEEVNRQLAAGRLSAVDQALSDRSPG